MLDDHYMQMTVKDLTYAMDELSRAMDYLNDFISVNNVAFKTQDIANLNKRINKQIQSINNYIAPSITGDGK